MKNFCIVMETICIAMLLFVGVLIYWSVLVDDFQLSLVSNLIIFYFSFLMYEYTRQREMEE